MLLQQLKKRDDRYYEPFRKALKATDQKEVLQQYFPRHPVCSYEVNDINVQL